MTKLKKYTEKVMIRLSGATYRQLKKTARHLEMNEAVYCRRAIELVLKRHLINKNRA